MYQSGGRLKLKFLYVIAALAFSRVSASSIDDSDQISPNDLKTEEPESAKAAVPSTADLDPDDLCGINLTTYNVLSQLGDSPTDFMRWLKRNCTATSKVNRRSDWSQSPNLSLSQSPSQDLARKRSCPKKIPCDEMVRLVAMKKKKVCKDRLEKILSRLRVYTHGGQIKTPSRFHLHHMRLKDNPIFASDRVKKRSQIELREKPGTASNSTQKELIFNNAFNNNSNSQREVFKREIEKILAYERGEPVPEYVNVYDKSPDGRITSLYLKPEYTDKRNAKPPGQSEVQYKVYGKLPP